MYCWACNKNEAEDTWESRNVTFMLCNRCFNFQMDMEKAMTKPTKLYNVPRNTWISIEENPDANRIIYFDHIDGMYSYCLDVNGNILHLAASSEVYVQNYSFLKPERVNEVKD